MLGYPPKENEIVYQHVQGGMYQNKLISKYFNIKVVKQSLGIILGHFPPSVMEISYPTSSMM